MLGNAFLLLVPLVLFLSSRRSDAGFFIIAGYCVTVAVTSIMALAFRDRFSFWAGLCRGNRHCGLCRLCAGRLPGV